MNESCGITTRHAPRWTEDTEVLLFLDPDSGGSGARWTPIIPQAAVSLAATPARTPANGPVPVSRDAVLDALRAAGKRTEPDWRAPAETADPGRQPACFHDAPTLPNLARAAELGVRATVTGVAFGIATLRVTETLKGAGIAAGTELTVDNGRFAGGLTACAETRPGDAPPRLAEGMDVVALLRREGAGGGAEWRPAGIDGAGIYLVDPPASFDSGQLQALPEPRDASLNAVRVAGGAVLVTSSGPAPSATTTRGSDLARYLGVACGVTLLAAAAALAVRRSRGR